MLQKQESTYIVSDTKENSQITSETKKNTQITEKTKESTYIVSDTKKYTVKISDEFITSDIIINIEIENLIQKIIKQDKNETNKKGKEEEIKYYDEIIENI